MALYTVPIRPFPSYPLHSLSRSAHASEILRSLPLPQDDNPCCYLNFCSAPLERSSVVEERWDIQLECIRSTFRMPLHAVRNHGGAFVIGLPALDGP